DDTAWTIVPQTRQRTVLLVGEGNAYLQSALSLLPDVELYGATPQDYAKTTGKDLFDLVIFDGFLPRELPRKPILAIAPPRPGEPFAQTAGPIGAQAPGAPVELPLPVDSTGLLVTRPDGTTVDVPASVSGAGSVTFAQTAQLGVYRVETKTAPGASPSASPATSPSTSPGESSPPAGGAPGLGTPFASATPASNPSASASPGASPAPSPGTPEAERFFAVDLFD